MKITFIQTGGTIDKDYPNFAKGWAFEFGEPAMDRILDKLNPSFEYNVLTSCQKDSLEITDEDRAHLVEIITKEEGEKFVVTHGTDTLLETAKFISDHIKDKLVVMTGSMLPERFSNSEAPINVGAAIATANLMDVGVYVTMHGISKLHNEVSRDLETGKFY